MRGYCFIILLAGLDAAADKRLHSSQRGACQLHVCGRGFEIGGSSFDFLFARSIAGLFKSHPRGFGLRLCLFAFFGSGQVLHLLKIGLCGVDRGACIASLCIKVEAFEAHDQLAAFDLLTFFDKDRFDTSSYL